MRCRPPHLDVPHELLLRPQPPTRRRRTGHGCRRRRAGSSLGEHRAWMCGGRRSSGSDDAPPPKTSSPRAMLVTAMLGSALGPWRTVLAALARDAPSSSRGSQNISRLLRNGAPPPRQPRRRRRPPPSPPLLPSLSRFVPREAIIAQQPPERALCARRRPTRNRWCVRPVTRIHDLETLVGRVVVPDETERFTTSRPRRPPQDAAATAGATSRCSCRPPRRPPRRYESTPPRRRRRRALKRLISRPTKRPTRPRACGVATASYGTPGKRN